MKQIFDWIRSESDFESLKAYEVFRDDVIIPLSHLQHLIDEAEQKKHWQRWESEKMEHDGCEGCKYDPCAVDSEECTGCIHNAIDKYEPMTNADRIRCMSDEELAELLQADTCVWCSYQHKYCMDVKCTDGILEWLKSEAKE